MMNERWVAAAIRSDDLVAELLLRLKQSASSDSSLLPTTSTATANTSPLNPLGWGDRKSRSKPSITASAAITNGYGKGQQQRSPSTPLSWSGGGATSTSDGYGESSRPSNLSSGDIYVKVESTCIDKKSRKRKVDLHQDLEMELGNVESKIGRFLLPDLNETPAYE